MSFKNARGHWICASRGLVRFRSYAAFCCVVFAIGTMSAQVAVAGSPVFSDIYNFTGSGDGGIPYPPPIIDSSGALYGTDYGGANSSAYCGVVYKLSAPPAGKVAWTRVILHRFGCGKDGERPYAGLVMDKAGNLYGTTVQGGIDCNPKTSGGCGTVFEVSPPASPGGAWTESVLHAFSGPDGEYPVSSVILDGNGALYGTAQSGGSPVPCLTESFGCGVVFKLEPPVAGQTSWTETVLHNFSGGTDGQYPASGLVEDANGVLYGTTLFGGNNRYCPAYPGCGVAFALSPPAAGETAWSETVLHTFIGKEGGATPQAGLVFGSSGELYGLTGAGGILGGCPSYNPPGCGVVFKLTPPAAPKATWTQNVIYDFHGGSDGRNPAFQGLTIDGSGALYGTTPFGGVTNTTSYCYMKNGSAGCGVVFKLTPPAPGKTAWDRVILHAFSGPTSNSYGISFGGITLDPDGVLYGVMYNGGTHDDGYVYKLTP